MAIWTLEAKLKGPLMPVLEKKSEKRNWSIQSFKHTEPESAGSYIKTTIIKKKA